MERSKETQRRELEIAQEEVVMLEHEKERLRRDKANLAAALTKLDKIVYGDPLKRRSRGLDTHPEVTVVPPRLSPTRINRLCLTLDGD